MRNTQFRVQGHRQLSLLCVVLATFWDLSYASDANKGESSYHFQPQQVANQHRKLLKSSSKVEEEVQIPWDTDPRKIFNHSNKRQRVTKSKNREKHPGQISQQFSDKHTLKKKTVVNHLRKRLAGIKKRETAVPTTQANPARFPIKSIANSFRLRLSNRDASTGNIQNTTEGQSGASISQVRRRPSIYQPQKASNRSKAKPTVDTKMEQQIQIPWDAQPWKLPLPKHLKKNQRKTAVVENVSSKLANPYNKDPIVDPDSFPSRSAADEEAEEELEIPWNAEVNNERATSLMAYDRNIGNITLELGKRQSLKKFSDQSQSTPKITTNRTVVPSLRYNDDEFLSQTAIQGSLSADDELLSVSVDPLAAIRLLVVAAAASKSFMMASLGTLRLLGPLIFARRALAPIGEMLSDFMTVRYLRSTYHKIDRQYWRHYQGPAASRSLIRTSVNMFALMQCGRLMEWMVELGEEPCQIQWAFGTCHWYCGILWLVSTVGAGNIAAAVLSIILWPLRIKVSKSASTANQSKHSRLLTRPWYVLRLLKDPDKSISKIATARRASGRSAKPFMPEPLLFPVSWPPFRMLRYIAVAKAMASSSDLVANSMHVVMRQFLIEQALIDEWRRVLMQEGRVGLGASVIALAFVATSFLFVTVALVDPLAAVMLLPSLLATFASAWMNFFIYWDRKRDRMYNRKLVVKPANRDVNGNRQTLGTLTYEYQIKW